MVHNLDGGEKFSFEYVNEDHGFVRLSRVTITRVSDGVQCSVTGNGAKQDIRVPVHVAVYWPNGEAQAWTTYEGTGTPNLKYRREIEPDFVEEIDRQIPLLTIMLS
jgi:hypothetical protein